MLAAAACEQQVSCCTAPTETKDECVEKLRLVLDPLFSIDGIEFDQAKLDACVAKLEAADCEQAAAYGGHTPILGWCDPFFSGTLANGETCKIPSTGDFAKDLSNAMYADDRCASGYCTTDGCAELPGENESCSGSCAEGLRCSSEVCVRLLPQGEACDGVGVCAEGLKCIGESDARTCEVPAVAQIGEPCTNENVCILGDGACFCETKDGCPGTNATCGGKRVECAP